MTYDSLAMGERRKRILHETRKLINEEGLEGFSMRKISMRAEVAPKTLYNAFGDRDRLIGLAIREMYDAVRENVKFRTSDKTLAGLLDRARRGLVKSGSSVVCVLTGSGLKDPDRALTQSKPRIEVGAEVESIAGALGW